MAKKNTYRLQPLVTLKERKKQAAELALATALVQLEKEKKALNKLEEEKAAIIRHRKATHRNLHQFMMSGTSTGRQGTTHADFLCKLEDDEKEKGEEIVRQQERVQEAEVKVKRARRDYIDAAKELRIMEKHRELWRKKVRREMERREEREFDELSQTIHRARWEESRAAG